MGRSLIREGASLSVIDMDGDGAVELTPAAFWNFENIDPGTETDRESTWRARVNTYGPSNSHTRLLPRDRLVFVRWGSTSPGTRYRGQSVTSWAALTAKTQGEIERSLGDEAAGPLAQLFAVPSDPGAGGDDDKFAPLANTVADGARQGRVARNRLRGAWDTARRTRRSAIGTRADSGRSRRPNW